MTRDSLAFIGRSYQPLLSGFGDSRSILLSGLRAPRSTKTDQTHSRSVALLTRLHPKCPFQVKLLRVRAFLLLLPSTGVLRSSRTIWSRSKPVNTAPYLSLQRIQRWGLNAKLLPDRARIVRILLGGSGMRPARSVQPEQRHLDMFRAWIDVQHASGQADSAVEVPSFDVVVQGSLDDFQVRRVEPVAVRSRPFLVLEVEREPPVDMPRPTRRLDLARASAGMT